MASEEKCWSVFSDGEPFYIVHGEPHISVDEKLTFHLKNGEVSAIFLKWNAIVLRG